MKNVIVCLVCLLIVGCEFYKQQSVNLTSLDTVKKYLAGSWEYEDKDGNKHWHIYRFEDIRFFKNDIEYGGIRDLGLNKKHGSYARISEPPYFQLRKENDSVKVLLIFSLPGKTKVESIEFLSKDELIIDGKSFKKSDWKF
ncbi:MAG: hypothetical protein V4642_05760 [Bacteroidota bacterium]